MGCTRVRLRQQGRKKYPLVRNIPKYEYISNTNFEIESLIIEMLDSDTMNVIFETPFSSVPSVVANFITPLEAANVNVYVESTSPLGATIRTSAPVTGLLHVHAMYIDECGPAIIEPIIITLPILGPVVVGGNPVITPVVAV